MPSLHLEMEHAAVVRSRCIIKIRAAKISQLITRSIENESQAIKQTFARFNILRGFAVTVLIVYDQ